MRIASEDEDDGPDSIRRKIGAAARRIAAPYSGPRTAGARLLSRSRRDGVRPRALEDVTRYLTGEVLGLGPAELARDSGASRSTVRKSIERGRRLAAEAALGGSLREPPAEAA
jgi:hypothetical protein